MDPEYDYRPVRPSTATKLTEQSRRMANTFGETYNPNEFCIMSRGPNTFEWDGQKWMKRLKKPLPTKERITT
jgi:hypothetical protein